MCRRVSGGPTGALLPRGGALEYPPECFEVTCPEPAQRRRRRARRPRQPAPASARGPTRRPRASRPPPPHRRDAPPAPDRRAGRRAAGTGPSARGQRYGTTAIRCAPASAGRRRSRLGDGRGHTPISFCEERGTLGFTSDARVRALVRHAPALDDLRARRPRTRRRPQLRMKAGVSRRPGWTSLVRPQRERFGTPMERPRLAVRRGSAGDGARSIRGGRYAGGIEDRVAPAPRRA